MTNSKKAIFSITECAVFIALSVALSYFKISPVGLGGSIDFVMIPLFIICYRQGAVYGLSSGLVFGLIKCLIGGGIGYGLPSVLLDYVLAYGAVGVAGFFKNKPKLIGVAALAGCFARFIIHFISGITIYAITTEEEVANVVTSNAWLYSLIYNGLYMLPNTVIAVAVMSLLIPALERLPEYRG
ncbi:MAG: energy-coupled thiamine transporter ThiT [Clostridia bacterium]|nr:energy-coupled thiamine transporter ThiT [Clostridia bacterium]